MNRDHLPILAQPKVEPDLRPLFATLFAKWRESKVDGTDKPRRKDPSYQALADDVFQDTGHRITRHMIYKIVSHMDEPQEHRNSRQPPWWLILWLCHRLGLWVRITPDGVSLVWSKAEVSPPR